METDDLIPASAFCSSHQLEITFLYSLQQHGLLETVTTNDTMFIYSSQLPVLEKLVRMHYELDINLEGIEVITHLLERMDSMQQEMTRLKNRLNLYDAE
jgi:chaperone modulatory protein CbpM